MNYSLIDTGNGKKLEKWGDYLIIRPSSQSIWKPSITSNEWKKADAIFTRDKSNKWIFKR